MSAMYEACPELYVVLALATEFQRTLREQDVNALVPRLELAEAIERRPLAAGLERDRDAVLAAISFNWSNGQMEDQVNRVKLVNRKMYGRAGFGRSSTDECSPHESPSVRKEVPSGITKTAEEPLLTWSSYLEFVPMSAITRS